VKPGAPLVIALHGRLGQGRNQAKLTGLDAVADEAGFIVVYPDGVNRSWADGRGTTPADRQGVDDVGFLSTLIDDFIAKHGVDPHRVYVTGMSNGGMMSFRLACELSGRVAAIAPVAALMSEKLADTCKPSRPVPVMAVAGTEDPLVPFHGGPVSGDRGPVLSAADTFTRWAAWNGCPSGVPTVTKLEDRAPDDGTRVRREALTNCRDGSEVVLYAVEGGGHTWPGGQQYLRESLIGRTSKDVDASRAIWAFFARLRRP
jgi:polyhydroxybutyrate depolymerase